ncbi:sensor histidine kinase [Lutibacter citreus]|uniref:sensor histidine kinase n=1 Tax=Lutibacter citreus TaxID=2138210 RepID=UPI0015CFEB4F|nr:PAS domain-containing sensor histidine kinase [Lutibacter citreus]
MHNKIEILERALQRQKAARKEAEKILESKSYELFNVSEELKKSYKKLEDLLQEKTSELEGVFLNIIDAYVVMDLQGNVLRMNDSAEDMLGYDLKKDELNLMSIVHEDYFEYTKQSFKELYEKGSYTDFQVIIRTKNNTEKLVQVNSSIIYNKEGAPIAAQGILRDITLENSIKELVEQQKKQLNIVVDHSPIGIALSNKDDKGLIMANNALCKLLGYSMEEFKNIKLQEVTHKEDKEDSNKLRDKLYNNKVDSYFLEKRYLKKDNDIVWARTSVTAVKDSNNRVKYHVTTIEDITTQKKLEKQKEELLNSLEKQNEQLNDYAHIVSHDLKSPLRAISALLSWTKEDFEDKLGTESLFNLNLMEDKVYKMDKLIGDILSYSSIGQEGDTSDTVNVNNVVKDIIDIIYIPSHIKVIIKNELPTIVADATRLQQLFQNIMSNAINYIDKEEGLVEVGYKDSKDFYVFSVKDNGCGIPKENHEKIFKMFKTYGDYEKSTGIGLSIVKKVVELYEGEIWLESEEGKGTTFFFSIKK